MSDIHLPFPWVKTGIVCGILAALAVLLPAGWWVTYRFVPDVRKGMKIKREMAAVMARRAEIESRWNALFGPLDQFPVRHPVTPPNDAARNLDVELEGLDLGAIIAVHEHHTPAEIDEMLNSLQNPLERPKRDPRQAIVQQRQGNEIRKLRGKRAELVTDYLTAQLERPDDVIDAPSAELTAELETSTAGIARVRTLLNDGDAPAWEEDYRTTETPLPNLLAFMQLSRLLAVDALAAGRSGDPVRSAGDLRAMATLSKAMGARPALVCDLLAIAAERYRLGVIRKLVGFPAVRDLGAGTPLNRAMLREAFAQEVWFLSRSLNESMTAVRERQAKHRLGRLLPPPDGSELAVFLLDYQSLVIEVSPAFTDSDSCISPQDVDPIMNRHEWNFYAVISLPNVTSNTRRLQRLEMERELTARLIAAEGDADSVFLANPAHPGCRSGEWKAERSPDGSAITLRFSQPIDWGTLKGPKIPLVFTLHASGQPPRIGVN